MLTDEQMRERMVNGWRAGKPFTICGNGSLPENTRNVRKALPVWCEKYGIRTVNDAGAGDMRWMEGIEWTVEYHPFDLFPRSPAVRKLDITTETMPSCDLVVCRMVLNHLDRDRVVMALPRLNACARYLALTQFNGENLPQRSPQFKRLDLREWLGEPLEAVRDGPEPECTLALWRC